MTPFSLKEELNNKCFELMKTYSKKEINVIINSIENYNPETKEQSCMALIYEIEYKNYDTTLDIINVLNYLSFKYLLKYTHLLEKMSVNDILKFIKGLHINTILSDKDFETLRMFSFSAHALKVFLFKMLVEKIEAYEELSDTYKQKTIKNYIISFFN